MIDNKNSFYIEKDGVKLSVREISEFLIDNDNAFFKDKIFKMWFKENANQALREMLKENNLERVVMKK